MVPPEAPPPNSWTPITTAAALTMRPPSLISGLPLSSVLWLAGIRSLSLIGWDSVAWPGPFSEPELWIRFFRLDKYINIRGQACTFNIMTPQANTCIYLRVTRRQSNHICMSRYFPNLCSAVNHAIHYLLFMYPFFKKPFRGKKKQKQKNINIFPSLHFWEAWRQLASLLLSLWHTLTYSHTLSHREPGSRRVSVTCAHTHI